MVWNASWQKFTGWEEGADEIVRMRASRYRRIGKGHRSEWKLLEAVMRVCSSPSSRRCLPLVLLAPNQALNRGKFISPATYLNTLGKCDMNSMISWGSQGLGDAPL